MASYGPVKVSYGPKRPLMDLKGSHMNLKRPLIDLKGSHMDLEGLLWTKDVSYGPKMPLIDLINVSCGT